mmetsp:Transcript_92306/g.214476  ORF Transcript_92306/g.214476 Transcript_92306/m.214476 type:complete len:248 (-) Transcript_92306:182-925(-)
MALTQQMLLWKSGHAKRSTCSALRTLKLPLGLLETRSPWSCSAGSSTTRASSLRWIASHAPQERKAVWWVLTSRMLLAMLRCNSTIGAAILRVGAPTSTSMLAPGTLLLPSCTSGTRAASSQGACTVGGAIAALTGSKWSTRSSPLPARRPSCSRTRRCCASLRCVRALSSLLVQAWSGCGPSHFCLRGTLSFSLMPRWARSMWRSSRPGMLSNAVASSRLSSAKTCRKCTQHCRRGAWYATCASPR